MSDIYCKKNTLIDSLFDNAKIFLAYRHGFQLHLMQLGIVSTQLQQ